MKLQLQVGKTYKTIDGTTVTIIQKTVDDAYPFKGDDGFSYSSTGSYFLFRVSEADLVEEVCTESNTVTIPNSLIEKLKSLAQQKSWNDIINGQSDLAKEILQELDINWNK